MILTLDSFQVGYIFGGMGVVGLLWTYWFLPDNKGRTLEELDELFLNVRNLLKDPRVKFIDLNAFAQGVSVREWTNYRCTGHVQSEHKGDLATKTEHV